MTCNCNKNKTQPTGFAAPSQQQIQRAGAAAANAQNVPANQAPAAQKTS